MPTVAYKRYSTERTKAPMETIHLPEAASQSGLAGELAMVHTDGTVKAPAAAGSAIDTTTCPNGLVLLLQNYSGTTGTELEIGLIDDETSLFLPICTSSGTATGTYVASSAAMVGDKYAGLMITAASSGGYFSGDQVGVDTNNTTDPVFRIIKFDRREAIGVTGNVHFAWVSVLPTARFK